MKVCWRSWCVSC